MTKKVKLKMDFNKLPVCGVAVNFLNLTKALSEVEKWDNTNKQYQITTPNSEQIILAQKDLEFKNILNNSDLAIADGVGVVIAAKLLWGLFQHADEQKKTIISKQELKIKFERLSGVDFMLALCKLAAEKKWRVFLLGGAKNIAAQAAAKIKAIIKRQTRKNLNINYFSGPTDVNKQDLEQFKQTIKKINNYKPQLLFVAFGAPEQEKWIAKNLPKLKVKIAMGVGGAFDYFSGRIKRAPLIVQKLGLEWLCRLIKQPWRWKRQLRLMEFIFLVLKTGFNKKKN